jgi:hypothetical protein
MKAVGKFCDLTWSGNNWKNYNNSLSVQENVEIIYKNQENPDVVVAYKPLEFKEYSKTEAIKCIRYNEMYDVEWTKKEINESGAEIIVCHHLNDMKQYQEIYKDTNIKFFNVPHSAEKTIFKDYNLTKEVDILLVGSIFYVSSLGDHYPLRQRMSNLLSKIDSKYKCGVFPHPGGDLSAAHNDVYAKQFAMAMNSSKICVTCSGTPKSRFGKYVEIPMCATAIAADLPGEQQEEINKFLIEINMTMSDDEIINKLTYFLENEDKLQEKINFGLEYAEQYTQEKYAKRFMNIFN